MAKQTLVNGLSQLRTYLNSIQASKKPVFILFTGDKDENGISWCPDCNYQKLLIIKHSIQKLLNI
jgi:hypothetical protein